MRKTIIMARTNGFEELPGEVAALAEAWDPSITAEVNIPREHVLEEMAMGGPAVEAARESLRQRARGYRDPDQRRLLPQLISDGLTEWKQRRG